VASSDGDDPPLGDGFDPIVFGAMIQSGVLDGRLTAELKLLTPEQLAQVAVLLAERSGYGTGSS
jgi:hypothetical protein